MDEQDDSAYESQTGLKPSFYVTETRRLRRFFRRSVAEEEAGDLVQEAFVRLTSRRSTTPLLNPAAYLQRIARNLIADVARRRATAPIVLPLDDERGADMATGPDQTHGLEADELMAAYERAVEALPPRTREVFLLQRVGGLSYQAVAVRLGIGVRTVEWHMGEALLRIRRALDAR